MEVIAVVFSAISLIGVLGLVTWNGIVTNSNSYSNCDDSIPYEEEGNVSKECLFSMLDEIKCCKENEKAEKIYDLESMLDTCRDKKLKKAITLELKKIKCKFNKNNLRKGK